MSVPSLYASTRRNDLDPSSLLIVNHPDYDQIKYRNGLWQVREAKILGTGPRSGEIKRQIALMLGFTNEKWYVHDTIPGTGVFMVREIVHLEMRIVGGVPFTVSSTKYPEWDGLIVDVNDPEFRIPSFWKGERIVTREPLRMNADNGLEIVGVSEETFEILENEEEDVVEGFSKTLHAMRTWKITPAPETPILRLWKWKDGSIYLSSLERIDCTDYKRAGISPTVNPYGEIFTDLGGRFDVFTEENSKCIYYLQMNSPELRSSTSHPTPFGIIFLDVRSQNDTPCEAKNPGFLVPLVMAPNEANLWMSLSDQQMNLDERMLGGDSLIIEAGDEKYYVVPYSQAWRQDAFGTETDNLQLRYQQLMNVRFLNPYDFAKIWPVIGPIETPFERQLTMTYIFTYIVPENLRPLTQEIMGRFWGPGGKIFAIINYLLMRKQLSAQGKAKLDINQQEILGMAMAYHGDPYKQLFDLFFQADPRSPHVDGNMIHKVYKDYESFNKLAQKKNAQQNEAPVLNPAEFPTIQESMTISSK